MRAINRKLFEVPGRNGFLDGGSGYRSRELNWPGFLRHPWSCSASGHRLKRRSPEEPSTARCSSRTARQPDWLTHSKRVISRVICVCHRDTAGADFQGTNRGQQTCQLGVPGRVWHTQTRGQTATWVDAGNKNAQPGWVGRWMLVVESGHCCNAPLARLRAPARIPMAAGDCEGVFELAAHLRTNEKPLLRRGKFGCECISERRDACVWMRGKP